MTSLPGDIEMELEDRPDTGREEDGLRKFVDRYCNKMGWLVTEEIKEFWLLAIRMAVMTEREACAAAVEAFYAEYAPRLPAGRNPIQATVAHIAEDLIRARSTHLSPAQLSSIPNNPEGGK